jgi:hypothetical protein
MAQYKVIAGCCPGTRKVHKYGSIITELDVKNVSQCLRDGFIVLLPESAEVAQSEPLIVETAKAEAEEPKNDEPIVEQPKETELNDPFKIDLGDTKKSGNKRK